MVLFLEHLIINVNKSQMNGKVVVGLNGGRV